MKLTAFLILTACLQVAATGHAQKISISVKEAPLEKVFREIHRQSGYSFWYNTKQLDKATKVTVDLKNATLEEALRKCFQDQPFDYSIVEQTVVIKPRLTPEPAPVPPIIVHGKVTTATGKPLAGVSVTIKGAKKGTATDDKGEFTLSVNKGETILVSYVGYDPREIKITDQESVEVSLTESNSSLNEIAVIGYGRQTRKNLSSAISTVKKKTSMPAPSPTSASAAAG
ncbi:carboxypeptidase-like regulatory domain-containing protein [Puia sp. P3]|uniref:STN domain-containing protein n=1 Tax=Puia sp. P3 TaxID=3423952 RepID=UPI003D679D57